MRINNGVSDPLLGYAMPSTSPVLRRGNLNACLAFFNDHLWWPSHGDVSVVYFQNKSVTNLAHPRGGGMVELSV